MSSPTPSSPGRHRSGAASEPPPAASVVALSGLLKVQRRWLLASAPGSEIDHAPQPAPTAVEKRVEHEEAGPVSSGRARLSTHLEESEWSRLAVGFAAEVLASLGIPATAEVLQLYPDVVVVHLPTAEAARWPFLAGPTPESWLLPRDSLVIASLPVTPAILKAARQAALVTLSESDGRRALIDLIAVGSTILKGPLPAVGEKIADIAIELGTRRWSDLETLILVDLEEAMPPLERTVHARDVAAALDELTVRSMNGSASSSLCVIMPPWASDPADPVLGELVRYSEATEGAGILCCASSEGALCLWELADQTNRPSRTQVRRWPPYSHARLPKGGSRRNRAWFTEQLPGPVDRAGSDSGAVTAPTNLPDRGLGARERARSTAHRSPSGNAGRLTELVAYLAMHPDGATTDAFATALWPERRVPLQTLANRLSEARKALGAASDGRPRLRKEGRRHLIVEVRDRLGPIPGPRVGRTRRRLMATERSLLSAADHSTGSTEVNGLSSRASAPPSRRPWSESRAVSASTPWGGPSPASPTGPHCKGFSSRRGTSGSTGS